MAKKAVATFGGDKTSAKSMVKCIRLIRSNRSGAYAFKEDMLPAEEVSGFFSDKK